MKLFTTVFVTLCVLMTFQSAFAELIDGEESSIQSEQMKSAHSLTLTSLISEREAFNYRENLVDLTRFFPGFDYNNELTDDGADFLENGEMF